MLSFVSPKVGSMCDRVSRRGFLRLGSLGIASLALPDLIAAQDANSAARRDTAVILWFMAGGPSQIETWDPKPSASELVRGPYASIPTRTPGVRFCELLPRQAAISDKFTIIRSLTHHENNHPDATHLVQTGYHESGVQFRGQIYPAQGSIVSKLRGPSRPGIPPYVCIPDAYFARQGFFQLATYLGREFDPVNSGSEPTFRFTQPGPSFGLPGDVNVLRSDDRRELVRRLDSARRLNAPAIENMDRATQRAYDLITSRAAQDAFDLGREPQHMKAMYGDNSWGRSALLARRLVEAGVTFVTVNHYEADVDWWDDHYEIESNIARRLPPFDRALAALIEDIHTRGLAERVLVIAMGEFGRTPGIGGARMGRDHWARAMSALVAGGGFRGGRVIGSTTSNAGEPASNAHSPGDMLATIYQFLGIDPAGFVPNRQDRPMRLVDSGSPIAELAWHY